LVTNAGTILGGLLLTERDSHLRRYKTGEEGTREADYPAQGWKIRLSGLQDSSNVDSDSDSKWTTVPPLLEVGQLDIARDGDRP
jgi:hypothetical protein